MSSEYVERVPEWLGHIVQNIDRIASHVGSCDFEAFAADKMRVDAVERCLERIIEATLRIGPARMSAVAPDLPLHKMRGLGNRLRHQYETVDLGLIWDTLVDELPALRASCEAALHQRPA